MFTLSKNNKCMNRISMENTRIATEDEILRARQLRVLREAGIAKVDDRVRHLLATGKLSAGQVVKGYARLMWDIKR